jgi:predicted Mrr-cat superfamily restriction endonuclease
VVWVVRAGHGAEFFDLFRDRRLIATSVGSAGDLSGLDEAAIIERVRSVLPAGSPKVFHIAGMLRRVASDMSIGDWVVTTDSSGGRLLIGRVSGDYKFTEIPELRDYKHTRPVQWFGEVEKARFSRDVTRALVTPQALFQPAAQQQWLDSLASLSL